MGKKKSIVNLNSEIYYKGSYWNDIESVRKYMSKNFTGNGKKWWIQDFKERYAKKPFKHALFLNCGDGRFERDFIDKKIVSKVTAFDISPGLIKKANNEKGSRNIKYQISDVNTVGFEKDEFDLAVNIAGLHHVQYIDRFCRVLATTIKEDGVIVNFDYIGPHRNQYPLPQWVLVKVLNSLLPTNIRQTLRYPHLPTMLATDPTEAIHSDLIIESIEKYFDMVERHDTGGGVAYLLLTHNDKLNKLSKKELNGNVDKILKWDKVFSDVKIVPQLFSYFIAKPNKQSLTSKDIIKKNTANENKREAKAEKTKGVYTFIDYLKFIYWTKDNKKRTHLIKEYMKTTLR